MSQPCMVKPHIVVNKDYSYSINGATFPPPMHLLEPRYRDAAPFQYAKIRHLTSDEAIEEGIVNEYTFTEAWRRFG
ncbi:hypothetical protein ORIO_21080 (plasmid) [Cereibacter azotoformans]|uniref:hypothetical protein n=1 Tax=Cereibacter azotoformans TaxID=43057 RepID=UPI001EEB0E38|nr:hypothetical protein [Cereibacter azotoformans]ULB12288.1 hypothetical protein ORIO_21080 [Cereibacter azotoformans]